MKGIIFTVFSKMVEEKFGLETLDSIINESSAKTKGIYTSSATYPDSEFIELVSSLSRQKNLVIDSIIFSFGIYLINQMYKKHPSLFESNDLKSFLIGVDSIIHVEVRKIYPDADLPVFKYESPSSDILIMKYYSKRKMCTLAEGLIEGARLIYKQGITVQHNTCCKNGSECCIFEIHFKGLDI